ncbi:MAG TPA: hypothetical protein VEI81_00130 [Methanoregula sp.]|nr:hypothetical protein [Methanoregula sp.]
MSLVNYIRNLLLAGFSRLPSGLKLAVYRALGARIGRGVELGFGSFVIPFTGEFRRIRIGDGAVIGDGVRILAGSLDIGAQSQIKNDTRIWGQSAFALGPDSYIDQECHFDLRRDITIGRESVVSGGCWIYTHMLFLSVLSGAPYRFAPVTVGDRSYLGANVFVLPGVAVGSGAIVGARAVVTRDVGDGLVVAGNPAKEIVPGRAAVKALSDREKQEIVREILDQFLKVYEGRARLVHGWDTTDYIVTYAGQPVYYRTRIDDTAPLRDFARSSKKPFTLISFGIPGPVREYCAGNAICWFDLRDGTRSAIDHGPTRVIGRFLEDYGIRLVKVTS